MFSPLETLDDDLLIDLIYTQIVSDVFSGSIRISRDDISGIKSVLSEFNLVIYEFLFHKKTGVRLRKKKNTQVMKTKL